MQLSDINLLDLDVFASGPPHDWFSLLRAEAPVYWHPDGADGGFWAVTKYDDIVTVARNPALFSSSYERGGTVVLGHSGIEAQSVEAPRVINTMDPPEHLRYRRLVTGAFAPKAMDALEGAIRSGTATLIDKAIAEGVVDFVEAVAAEIPVQAIAEMLGVPESDRHLIKTWTDTLIGSDDPEVVSSPEAVLRASTEMFEYGRELRAARVETPGSDIISRLLASRVDGEALTEEELSGFFGLLIVAGAETSRNVLTHGLIGLLGEPDQYAALVADPTLVSAATEEILRWAPAVYYLGRHVTQDTQLGGQTLRAGDRVTMWFASGNRDEDKYVDPQRLLIDRRPKEHLAFGAGGHFCLGAHLARIEVRVAFEELVRRAPHIRVVEPPTYLRSNLAGGVTRFVVDLAPERGEARG